MPREWQQHSADQSWGKDTWNNIYRQVPNRWHTKSLNPFSSRLAVVFVQSIEAKYWVQNEYVVRAVPTGDAPTTSEWSRILLPIKVRLIAEFFWWLSMNFLRHDIFQFARYDCEVDDSFLNELIHYLHSISDTDRNIINYDITLAWPWHW